MFTTETQGTFEQQLANLTAKLGKVAPEATTPNSNKEPVETESVAKVINDLVGVVAQLSRIDKTIAQVTDGAPDEEQAKQWHLISLQALQCSRNMLAEKQADYLKKLKTLVPEAAPASDEAVARSTVATDHEVQVTKPPPGLQPPPGLSAAKPSTTKDSTWMGWSKEAVDACPEFVPQNANNNEAA